MCTALRLDAREHAAEAQVGHLEAAQAAVIEARAQRLLGALCLLFHHRAGAEQGEGGEPRARKVGAKIGRAAFDKNRNES